MNVWMFCISTPGTPTLVSDTDDEEHDQDGNGNYEFDFKL